MPPKSNLIQFASDKYTSEQFIQDFVQSCLIDGEGIGEESFDILCEFVNRGPSGTGLAQKMFEISQKVEIQNGRVFLPIDTQL